MDIVSDNKELSDKLKRTGVVLVHGLTGTTTEMKPLEKYLKKLGIDVENVMLAGHGAGHLEILATTWQDWVASARSGMQKILERNDKVIICGLSMGAIIAAQLAAEESRVSALVMLSPTLKYDGSVLDDSIIDWIYGSPFARNFMREVVKKVPFIGNKFYWEELPPYGIRDERIQRQITKAIEAAKAGGNNDFGVFRTYYRPLAEMMDLVDRVKHSMAKVKCPVLLMHSLDDTIASIHNSTETYLNLASNNKALFLLTGCDHVMTLDLQRHLVHKMIGRFCQSFSGPQLEHKTVRSVLSPVLLEAKFAKGGNLSAIISPEMHGLNKDEWKLLYPERRYAHLASVSDVNQLHSIVLRDLSQPVMSLPIFIGEYKQNTSFKGSSKISGAFNKIIAPSNATVLGLGSLVSELPGLGINESCSQESRSKALANLIRIIDSMARSASVDAFTNVQHQVPELPEPSPLQRANGNKPIKVSGEVHMLVSGKEKFLHRNTIKGFLARFTQVAVPQAHAEVERLEPQPIAANIG